MITFSFTFGRYLVVWMGTAICHFRHGSLCVSLTFQLSITQMQGPTFPSADGERFVRFGFRPKQ